MAYSDQFKWLNDKGEKVNHNWMTEAQQKLQDAAEDAYFATQEKAIIDHCEDPPNDEPVLS